MIKKGDKVFCIKDQEFIAHYLNSQQSCTHLKGNIYEVLNIRASDKLLYIQTEENYGVWFSIDDKNYNRRIFRDYFITLAEWRDQQIDKILEDE